MCWITLSPKDSKVHRHQHHRHFHHHHDEHSSLRSSIEHLIRRDRLAHETPTPTSQCEGRQESIRIITLEAGHRRRHRHHHYHEVHPLRLHPVPVKLHGPGKKRAPVPPRGVPTNSCPEQEPIYRIQPVPKPRVVPDPIYRMPIPTPRPVPDPIYRIQPISERADHRVHEVRETTRFALREVKPERTRLRRVAGYEVLSKQVPWSWDCVSRSTS